ncbi:hypothetical protein P0L94_08975 [Microbacter sp. GSS18]|nr:hypothetical protein P0L94_08975 [Microbacter sp. GSS18]
MNGAQWLSLIPATLVAVAAVLAPGLIATSALRIPVVARTALSGALGIALIGAAGVLASLVGIAFSWWQPAVLGVVIGIAVWAADRRRPVALPRERLRAWAPVLAMAVSTAVISFVAFAGVPDPEKVSQTYDNVFHMSAIASILGSGDASSLTLRTIIETDRTFSFYPAAWHALAATVVQVTGASLPAAVNASWIAAAGGIWVPGAMWLAQTALTRYRPGVVGMVAAPLAAVFGGMPYVLLSWGTLYPNFLANALIPVAVAVPLAWWRARSARRGRARRAADAWGAAGVVAVLAAVGFAQPRALVTWAVILAPVVVATAVTLFRRALDRGGRSRRRAWTALWTVVGAVVVVAAVGFAYVVLALGLFERPLDERLGGPQAAATQSVAAGIGQVLTLAWPTGVGDVVVFPSLVLAACVAIGAVVAVRTRGLRWVVVAYGILAVLFALAAGSDDVLTKLATALWYKDRYRLLSALPILGVVLATLGILAVAARIRARRSLPPSRLAPIVSAWVVAAVTAATLTLGGVSSSIAAVFRMPETAAQDDLVSAEQVRFLASLDELVPAGQLILGDPWDGSAWTWVFGEHEPVFPHLNGQWDANRRALAFRLDQIEENPEICGALDALQVRYVLYSPHDLDQGDPAGDFFPGPHAAVEAGLFELVAEAGDTQLYRIDQCGPLD